MPIPPVVLFTNSTIMGGMEEHVLQLGRGLARRGLRVGVICSPRDGIEPLRSGLRAAGVEVHALPEAGGKPTRMLRRFTDLRNVFAAYGACVLHLHSTGYRGADLVAVAARTAGARAVVRTMHLPPVAPVPVADRVLTPQRDRLLARIICVAEQNRIDHVRMLGRDPNKCIVIHNGVDLGQFSADADGQSARWEFGVDPDARVVGTVSRLGESRKGINYFIDMAADVLKESRTARFLIVGEGELRADLQRQAASLGISSRITFTGARSDIPRLLAAMDVFVNPSLWEAGPYTVLEAAAMRVPVVSTPVGFVPEVIQHDGNEGRMVAPRDSTALARAVLDVLADRHAARRMAEAAFARVVEDFSLERMLDRLIELYRDVSR